MRKTKIALGFILVILLAGIFTINVFADGTLQVTVVSPEATIGVGDEITITVGIRNNPGVSRFTLAVDFDYEALEFVDGQLIATGELGQGFHTPNPANPGSGVVVIVFARGQGDTVSTGDIATLTFRAIGEYDETTPPITIRMTDPIRPNSSAHNDANVPIIIAPDEDNFVIEGEPPPTVAITPATGRAHVTNAVPLPVNVTIANSPTLGGFNLSIRFDGTRLQLPPDADIRAAITNVLGGLSITGEPHVVNRNLNNATLNIVAIGNANAVTATTTLFTIPFEIRPNALAGNFDVTPDGELGTPAPNSVPVLGTVFTPGGVTVQAAEIPTGPTVAITPTTGRAHVTNAVPLPVNVTIANSPTLGGFSLSIPFDGTRLQLPPDADIRAAITNVLGGLIITGEPHVVNRNLSSATLNIVAIGNANAVTAATTLFTIPFEIRPNAPAGNFDVTPDGELGTPAPNSVPILGTVFTPGGVTVQEAEIPTGPTVAITPTSGQGHATNAVSLPVNVTIANSPALGGFNLSIRFDGTRLQLPPNEDISAAITNVLGGLSIMGVPYVVDRNLSSATLNIVAIGNANAVTAATTLFTIPFEIRPNALAGNFDVTPDGELGTPAPDSVPVLGTVFTPGGITITRPGVTPGGPFTITFNANGGRFADGATTATRTTNVGGTLAEFPASPTRPGHIFSGWFTAVTGGVQRSPGFTFSGHTPLWARWTPVGGAVAPPLTPGHLPQLPTLARPGGVALANGILTWDDVANAIGFRIYVDGVARTGIITERSFDLRTLGLDPGTYLVQVRAIGQGGRHNPSLPTAAFSIDVAADGTITPTVLEPVVMIPASHLFGDVPVGAWYHGYVTTVAHHGLFQGMAPGVFEPYTGMTRAMFARVLANMMGVDLTAYGAGAATFGDVAPTEWYFASVQWAASVGLVQGVGEGNFAPTDNVTREQMAVMLQRFANQTGTVLPTGEALPFVDQHLISYWAVDAVRDIQAAGIVVGRVDGSFDPGAFANRAEVATIFARFLVIFQ
ncbi:MAG: S-layer homology domain-containing protein [Clostridiales bacterium]|nr:S-layer homology domain-containing protein [Clostridiales bacterium]